MSATARLSLPFLSAGQAQKEFTHNEALQALDALVSAAVEESPRADPPASPAVGACYIVGAAPTGAWAGNPNAFAVYTSGGWRFTTPVEGMSAYVKTSGTWANYRSPAWELGIVRASGIVVGGQQVVGSRAPAISSATGGSTVDTQARAVIDQILGTLRLHGLIET